MKGERATAWIGSTLLLVGLLAACSTTTRGTGSAIGAPTSGPSSPAPSATPTGAGTPSTSPSASPPITGSAPVAIPAPASCPGASCRLSVSASLTEPFVIMVRVNPAFDAGAGATIVELTNAGVPVFWATITGEMPVQLTCSTSPDKSNCVLVDSVGAHGSHATVWRLGAGTLLRGSTVASDSPDMRALDLNGDGWVDAEGLQNTYNPDYASGAVYWQTWISDGTHLTSTGCTSPTHGQPAAPAAPVTGACAH